MTNDQKAAIITRQLAALLKGAANTRTEDDPFGSVMPSDDFLNTHLPTDGMDPAEVNEIAVALERAAAENNTAVVKEVAGLALGLIPGLKSISGLLG